MASTEPGATHEAVPVVTKLPVSLCQVCFEKVRMADGEWQHFGQHVPYETMVITNEEPGTLD